MSQISFHPLYIGIFLIIYTAVLCFAVSAYYQKKLQVLQELKKNDTAATEAEQSKKIITLLRPHFIFNCFSAIMYLCKKEPGKAADALGDLADFLRSKLQLIEAKDSWDIPFRTELSHIEAYARLEKLRFQEQLEFQFDITEKTFYVPSMSLFTETELAVKRARSVWTGVGIVSIRSFAAEDGYKVEIADNSLTDGASKKTFTFPKA